MNQPERNLNKINPGKDLIEIAHASELNVR